MEGETEGGTGREANGDLGKGGRDGAGCTTECATLRSSWHRQETFPALMLFSLPRRQAPQCSSPARLPGGSCTRPTEVPSSRRRALLPRSFGDGSEGYFLPRGLAVPCWTWLPVGPLWIPSSDGSHSSAPSGGRAWADPSPAQRRDSKIGTVSWMEADIEIKL